MAIKIVSDVHGEYEALAGQLDASDTAVMLGDYLNLIDFHTLEGILAEVYTKEEIIRSLSLLAEGNKEQVKRQIRQIAAGTEEKSMRVRELMAQNYREFFASIPCSCFLIYGNTDDPGLMSELAPGNVTVVDSGEVEIAGEVFGLVSGTPHGPWTVGLPGEMDPVDYDARINNLGPVDVLCTHYPPAVGDLTWDTLANRDEAGSGKLLEYLREYRPAYHYFGHVHNPRVNHMIIGETRLINAGFFRSHNRVIVHPQSR